MSYLEVALAATVVVPVLIIASYPMHAAVALRRSRARTARLAPRDRSVSVLVPVRGLDENVRETVEGLTAQTVRGGVEIVFCIESAHDAAAPFIRAAIAACGCRARVIVTGPSGTALGKMHNLIAGAGNARGEYLVLMDSDAVLPHRRFVEECVRALDDPHTGLVTCYPAYRGARSLPAAFLAASINHDLLGYFSLQAVWTGLALANGSCMAIRRDVLSAIGGLEPLRDSLLMDSKIAHLVRQAGYRVHLHPEPVGVVRQRVSVKEWWHQAHRWQVAMVRVLPLRTYIGFSWMRSWLPLAFGLVWLDGGGAVSVGLLIGATMIRTLSAVGLGRYLENSSQWRYLWTLPFVELANAAGCLYALVDRRVEWRGRRYRVTAGGRAMLDVGRNP